MPTGLDFRQQLFSLLKWRSPQANPQSLCRRATCIACLAATPGQITECPFAAVS